MALRAWICGVILAATAGASRFDDAAALQRQGKQKEARDVLRDAAAEFRASGDARNQARALGLAGEISLALGDTAAAISEAQAAIDLGGGEPEDYNTLGHAQQDLGNYAAALAHY